MFMSNRYGGHGRGNERLVGRTTKQKAAIVGREDAI